MDRKDRFMEEGVGLIINQKGPKADDAERDEPEEPNNDPED
jgi:hypothetical protein